MTGKAHSQLRRLRNESSILKDAVITAIPAHYSKVLFTCTRMTSPLKCVDYYLHHAIDDKEKLKVYLDLFFEYYFIRDVKIRKINNYMYFRNKLDYRKPPKNLPWDAERIDWDLSCSSAV